jgi:large subunit ribosomal protein L7/L12
MSNITKDQVIEWLSAQTVLDLATLVKDLEGKWGVSAAAAVAAAGPAAGAAAAAPVEEKTEFNVILLEAGANKIGVIKEVRVITGLGLKEAKDLVEAAWRNASPHQALGRPMKVSKEDVIGLLTAVEPAADGVGQSVLAGVCPTSGRRRAW